MPVPITIQFASSLIERQFYTSPAMRSYYDIKAGQKSRSSVTPTTSTKKMEKPGKNEVLNEKETTKPKTYPPNSLFSKFAIGTNKKESIKTKWLKKAKAESKANKAAKAATAKSKKSVATTPKNRNPFDDLSLYEITSLDMIKYKTMLDDAEEDYFNTGSLDAFEKARKQIKADKKNSKVLAAKARKAEKESWWNFFPTTCKADDHEHLMG